MQALPVDLRRLSGQHCPQREPIQNLRDVQCNDLVTNTCKQGTVGNNPEAQLQGRVPPPVHISTISFRACANPISVCYIPPPLTA